mmetsp:Transcript_49515/g.139365  ORF Transcript_49515/g.139365 Transcript_49515/m.139365 type:complete len:176 (-) Transcript_49515:69-596(-)
MLLCIGGVCVPYTAVLPIVILALKWVAVRLAQMGLLPKAVGDALQVSFTANADEKEAVEEITAAGPSTVKTLESSEDFHALLEKKDHKVVCKFTASWCKPCHKIQPFYEKLSSHFKGTSFLTVDVDEFDDIAGKYSVAMMPTFLVLQGEKVLGSYSGSSESELQRFLKEQVGRSE